MTTTATDYPLPRERSFIIASLLVLAAAAWALIAWRSSAMSGDGLMGPTMGLRAPVFLAILFPLGMMNIAAWPRADDRQQPHCMALITVLIFAEKSLRSVVSPSCSPRSRSSPTACSCSRPWGSFPR